MEYSVEQDLGRLKISKLLVQYALPAIIAMTAASLYNMVDSIFIGQGVGALAISGLAVTFPLMNLSVAFGTLVGAGAASLTSILLGQQNYAVAKKVLGNVVLLNLLVGGIYTLLALLFLDPILYFFGASPDTIVYARSYMVIILAGNVFTHLYFGLNAMMRSAGHPKQAMAATILTVALNAVLDPIFIFALDMGIQGAAIATVLAQCVSLVWLLVIFNDKKKLLHIEWRKLSLDKRIARDSLSIGMAPFLMNVASCLVVLFINRQLRSYGGDLAIGAYGIVNRLIFLFVMIVMGLNQGMQPIAGYNYGAKLYDRVIKVVKITIAFATGVMTVGFLLGMLCPRTMVSAFTRDEALIELAAQGFRIVVIFFPLAGFQIVTSNFFQSIGMAGKAIFLSLSRQLLFLLPCLILLPRFFGSLGVWYSMPVADLISTSVAAVLFFGLMKRFKSGVESDNGLSCGKQ